MSVDANQVKSRPIPTRVLTLKDWSQLPDCYSQTPGGTLFSTTPGGTRIIYDRKFLLDCRNSPLARTPPCCLPQIPGVTVPATHSTGKLQDLKEEEEEEEKDIAGKCLVHIRFICVTTTCNVEFYLIYIESPESSESLLFPLFVRVMSANTILSI
ncbi:eukaryotic translation initiation factor 4E-binding protein 3-like [Pundamilia nyererei]|uniref:Eukaryotic translation initiation factor 4E-binding protein 3-like n=2 Tax=Haplochromini TaxID=319058 RepID=A0A9Y3QNL3_9CICH|nr:PREDICTED: eukaryotic translation initiation factor 4E-binding protein 3-like [Pundamilia nyererei]